MDQLEALARTLGLRSDDLLDKEVSAAPQIGGDPIRLMLKSAEVFHPSAEVRFRMVEAARSALDLLELRDELGLPRAGFERFTTRPLTGKQPVHEQGAGLASDVRRKLGLTGPIASTRDLVSVTLGIPIIAADLTRQGPDAFSVYAPGKKAAMVLNLSEKNLNALVRRFSLAHELCHTLFDRPSAGPLGIACWQDSAIKLETEIRANAFAIRLLLPERIVRRAGKGVLNAMEFRRLMETYGVHYSALELYVKNLLQLGDEQARESIPRVDTTAPLFMRNAEELAAEREGEALPAIPLSRRGELTSLAARALVEERISRSRFRELLRLPADKPVEAVAEFLGISAPVPAA